MPNEVESRDTADRSEPETDPTSHPAEAADGAAAPAGNGTVVDTNRTPSVESGALAETDATARTSATAETDTTAETDATADASGSTQANGTTQATGTTHATGSTEAEGTTDANGAAGADGAPGADRVSVTDGRADHAQQAEPAPDEPAPDGPAPTDRAEPVPGEAESAESSTERSGGTVDSHAVDGLTGRSRTAQSPTVQSVQSQTADGPRVDPVVELVQRSFAAIEPRLEEVVRRFYARLFAVAPALRELFEINMQAQRGRFGRVLAHIVTSLDRPEELGGFLGQLGRDHLKFDVQPEQFPVFGQALLAALAEAAGDEWTADVAEAWAEVYRVVAHTMIAGMAESSGPASFHGHVVDHQRLDRDSAMITVRTDPPVTFRPGQYVSVEVPHRPRMWRSYSPVNAPDDRGELTFYVKAVSPTGVSRAMVAATRPGETWRLGPAMGRLPHVLDTRRPLLLVGGGTGIAPLMSILEHVEQLENAEDKPPSVVACYGVRRPDELHVLPTLRRRTYYNLDLTLIVAVEQDPPEGAEEGTLADVVTRYGAWADHEVVVSGSPEMLRTTIPRMLVAGTPADRIHYDPFPSD